MRSNCKAILLIFTSTTFTSVIVLTLQSQSPSDDTFYFDKSIADEETFLSSSDFELGTQLIEQLVGDDWPNEAVYQNDRFEGDIAMDLNVTTVQLFINGALSNQHFYYNAVRNRHQLWPHAVIPYAISSQYSTYSRSVIAASMQEYGTHTCIRWVPKNDNHISYVYIMPDRGCYSMVGRTGDILMLISQFEKYGHGTIQSLEMEYDYASIMHYGSRAFSRNGLPTIVPKDTAATIGQRTGFNQVSTPIMPTTIVPNTSNVTPITVTNSTAIIAPSTVPTSPFPSITIDTCQNRRWCKRNVEWMEDYCPESCGMCGTRPVPTCEDLRVDCSLLVLARHCKTSKTFMKTYCATSCGFCFIPPATEIPNAATDVPTTPKQEFLTTLPPSLRPLSTKASGQQKSTDLTSTSTVKLYCRDRKDFCTHWKDAGFCVGIFSSYMAKNCPHACAFC
uniref:Metalloendopeptidase n=1 Tax=Ascaris lumbricoides TaxID=6252 RepID=A0A0M3HUB3_ASCLU